MLVVCGFPHERGPADNQQPGTSNSLLGRSIIERWLRGAAVLSPAGLIERADQALYSAKNHGRNRIETWGSGLLEAAIDATSH